ncbi:unnamed protein product [Dovyalis caffra]|uniref:Uncharacterized protein n=1 Tax=Dovyalis caffra TaxID=77055 RepID=A0AAV1QPD6_9ROSI|nr:unnamed protein product [Dovyalis caffra]
MFSTLVRPRLLAPLHPSQGDLKDTSHLEVDSCYAFPFLIMISDSAFLFMFQNSLLGIVLDTQHFRNRLTAVLCAISGVCHSIFGSALAGIWRCSMPARNED